MLYPKEHLILKIGKGFTRTMMKTKAVNISGPSLTPPATPSGGGTTDTTTSWPWSSCPATWWEACSRGWTSWTRTPSHPAVSLERTTTTQFHPSGCLKGRIWPLIWMKIGKWTTPAMNGRSWILQLQRLGRWLINIGSGRVQTRRAGSSIKGRFLNKMYFKTGDGYMKHNRSIYC